MANNLLRRIRKGWEDLRSDPRPSQKLVFKVESTKGGEYGDAIMMEVLKLRGLEYMAFDMDDGILTVIGKGLDPVGLTTSFRRLNHANLISVGEAPQEKQESLLEHEKLNLGKSEEFKLSEGKGKGKAKEKGKGNDIPSDLSGDPSAVLKESVFKLKSISSAKYSITDYIAFSRGAKSVARAKSVAIDMMEGIVTLIYLLYGPIGFDPSNIIGSQHVSKVLYVGPARQEKCVCLSEHEKLELEKLELKKLKLKKLRLAKPEELILCQAQDISPEVELPDKQKIRKLEADKLVEEITMKKVMQMQKMDAESHSQLALEQSNNRISVEEHIFPPMDGCFVLMRGGLGLIDRPKEEDWASAKEIYLMDNEISELSQNLKCPTLQALFLQKNSKLRRIHPLFFSYMPALQVLNLSRTRIKTLPESLFGLKNLKKLFLNHCDLIMTLSPRVGELQHLEVLDLEGTEIMNLPEEVSRLTNLTCLNVSFCEPESYDRSKQYGVMIPLNVFSETSKLEELTIDVSPDDKRWSTCVEDIVIALSTIATLTSLKFYFPRVDLLSHFEGRSLTTLVEFKFSVGHHVKQNISRLPRYVEYELEQWDRCLKYVNGEGESVPMNIMRILGHATAFFLNRHMAVKNLLEFGYENMEQLKCCVVGECNKLETIIDEELIFGDAMVCLESLEYLYIYYMKSLKSICRGSLNSTNLSSLKFLNLRSCPELIDIFNPGLLATLNRLEELIVDDCPRITSLVSYSSSDNEFNSGLLELKKISLHYLPELVSIFTPKWLATLPKLEELTVEDCPKIATLASYICSENEITCVLPALKKISVHFLPELASISIGSPMSPSLEWMSFYGCPNLKSLPISKLFNENLKTIKGEQSWWLELRWENSQQDSWNDTFVPVD